MSRAWAAAASVAAMTVVLASAASVEPPALLLDSLAAKRAVGTSLLSTANQGVEYLTLHESSSCSDVPILLSASAECTTSLAEGCVLYTPSGYSGSGADTYSNDGCSDDWASLPDTMYGSEVYLRIDYYADDNCTTFTGSTVSLADGDCHAYPGTDSMGYSIDASVLTTINADGSASRTYYDSGGCSGEPRAETTVTAALLTSSTCSVNGSVAYTNTASAGDSTVDEEDVADDEDPVSVGEDEADDDDGLSTGAIVGIIVGAVAFAAIVAGLVMWSRRKRSSGDAYRETTE